MVALSFIFYLGTAVAAAVCDRRCGVFLARFQYFVTGTDGVRDGFAILCISFPSITETLRRRFDQLSRQR